jgi:hypothetical protein
MWRASSWASVILPPLGWSTTTAEKACALPADTSLPAGRVIRELKALVAKGGLPAQCVSDNVRSLVWRCCRGCGALAAHRLELHRPRKPQQNAFVESFYGRLGYAFLKETLFVSLRKARAELEA